MADRKNSAPGAAVPGKGGAQGFKLAGFPKEFERSFWEYFDKRFYAILLITWVVLYGFVFYMTSRDWRISEQEKEKIKQIYMKQLYAEIMTPEEKVTTEEEGGGMVAEEVAPKEEKLSEKSQKLVSESSAEKVKRRRASRGARRAKRAKMEQEAAGYGVLAALTAAGGGGTGEAYADVGDFGSTQGVVDASKVVGGTAALREAAGRGERTRIAKGGNIGGEVGETGIDDLVSGTGVSESVNVTRRGTIKLAQETKVTGRGAGASGRDPEVIDAVINQNKASVEYCYQSQLKIDPNLRGEILLSFVILPNGRVGAVKILRSTLNNKKVEKCIIQAVRRWRNFPKLTNSRAEVTIRTKFIFG